MAVGNGITALLNWKISLRTAGCCHCKLDMGSTAQQGSVLGVERSAFGVFSSYIQPLGMAYPPFADPVTQARRRNSPLVWALEVPQ